MISDFNRETLVEVRNPVLRSQAGLYLDIYDNFMQQVRASGIEIADTDLAPETAGQLGHLRQAGADFRNDDKSILVNAISPACVACRQGIGSATFFVSLQCHRTCFYCFNPNQDGYQTFSADKRNLPQELEALKRSGQKIKYLALTGGEPLLHKAEALEFFRSAGRLFPNAHTRLYTTGDQLTPELAAELRDSGLDEIRFSIRMHDLDRGHRHTFDRIALAKEYIPSVMVEMPILPGTLDVMKSVLLELDRLGVESINLLELCYPLNQAEAFNLRGYKVRQRPFRVLYDYWYAGGLPIAESELVCLGLVDFALQAGLKMGVHYCSLENKHTGQIYQQNAGQHMPSTYVFSLRDYFWKTAKVYGPDMRKARRALRAAPVASYRSLDRLSCLEVHPAQVAALKGLDVEVALSYNVVEPREDGPVVRELKLALTRPETFDIDQDL